MCDAIRVRCRSYLTQVIKPCYLTLAEQYADAGAVAKPYLVKNYDDFNETFWARSCLNLDIVGLTQDALRRKFNKTFVERQSWLLPLVSSATRRLTANPKFLPLSSFSVKQAPVVEEKMLSQSIAIFYLVHPTSPVRVLFSYLLFLHWLSLLPVVEHIASCICNDMPNKRTPTTRQPCLM